MLTYQEKNNMIHFLVNYFEGNLNYLMNMCDEDLEITYDQAYQLTEIERDQ